MLFYLTSFKGDLHFVSDCLDENQNKFNRRTTRVKILMLKEGKCRRENFMFFVPS